MATWRDLGLPREAEVWRELRGLRSGVAGPAGSDPQRRSVFNASLEQAQQFTEAAANAGPATRPVQIFYALSQFGRAISAASRLTVGIEWRLKGHGIGTKNLDASKGVAAVGVTPTAKGSLPGVARALGVPSFEAGAEVNLGQLWPLIPETHGVPLPGAGGVKAMYMSQSGVRYEEGQGWVQVHVMPVSNGVRQAAERDPATLETFLARYPTLDGWSRKEIAGAQAVSWEEQSNGFQQKLMIYVPDEKGGPEARDGGRATVRAKATAYRGPDDLFLFPSIGAMQEPVHPLLVWWALLFGLSMLARYEPEHWASIVDIDHSSDANAVEHLLDEAVAVVPHLALLAIQEVAGP
ncbi:MULTISPECIES: YaaC family protein [Streptomyces]|uniref:YaaC family protein n=1 Tax=Streptomyces TaxID=1883 RepID=UPI000D1C6578|nr:MULTISPECIES: YaaC family protein [unclassified Streptomyces]